MREHENIKTILSKIQLQNSKYKLIIKELRDADTTGQVKCSLSVSEHTSLMVKKIKKLH